MVAAFGRLSHTVEVSAPDAIPDDATVDRFDAVVIDGTVGIDRSVSACQKARSIGVSGPVLLVVAAGLLAALNESWGFDDWVLPEVTARELDARLRVAAERFEREADLKLRVGPLVIDEDAYDAKLAGEDLDLTPTEFELLRTLADNAGRVMTRESLLEQAWGYDFYGGIRTVDVHVRRVRAKLGPEHDRMIETVRGVGYKLVHRPARLSEEVP